MRPERERKRTELKGLEINRVWLSIKILEHIAYVSVGLRTSRTVEMCEAANYAVCCGDQDLAQNFCISFHKGHIFLADQTLYLC